MHISSSIKQMLIYIVVKKDIFQRPFATPQWDVLVLSFNKSKLTSYIATLSNEQHMGCANDLTM